MSCAPTLKPVNTSGKAKTPMSTIKQIFQNRHVTSVIQTNINTICTNCIVNTTLLYIPNLHKFYFRILQQLQLLQIWQIFTIVGKIIIWCFMVVVLSVSGCLKSNDGIEPL